jgi:hypothetical protein
MGVGSQLVAAEVGVAQTIADKFPSPSMRHFQLNRPEFFLELTRPFITLPVSRRLSCEENDDEDPTPRIIRCGNHCHQESALLQYARQGLPDGHQQL